jgi:hypothetical protein
MEARQTLSCILEQREKPNEASQLARDFLTWWGRRREDEFWAWPKPYQA